jgi:hypothetical protein
MISKIKKKRNTKSKKKDGGAGGPPVYNESYKDTIDLYNTLETRLNEVRDKIYMNDRDLLSRNNTVLEAEEESIKTLLDEIKQTKPEAYKYINDLIIYNYNENKRQNNLLKIKNRENTKWDRNIVSKFFAEYQDRKFANGYFYLNNIELRNKFSNLNTLLRVDLISNIKKLDQRLFHLLQLIIQKKDTRASYSELLNILDNNEVLYYAFE